MNLFYKCTLLFGFIMCMTCGYAQKVPIKFGKIDPSEFSLKGDEFLDAEAVVLADFGETDFYYSNDKGWQYKFKRIVRILILNKEGYDNGNINISYYEGNSNKEKVHGLRGFTYNLVNGKIEKNKLQNDAVFEEQLSESWYQKKFTFPNLKEGSIIEYEYNVLSDYISNLQTWSFQSTIPTKYSEYRLAIPEFFKYQRLYQGFEKFTISDDSYRDEVFTIEYTTLPQAGGKVEKGENSLKSRSKVYRWAAENLPAIKPEPFMTTASDYFTKLEFQLLSTNYPNQTPTFYMGTYEDKFTKNFIESDRFGKLLGRTGFAEDIISKLISSSSNNHEKMVTIYEHVKTHMEWNNQNRLFASSNLKSIYKDGKGSTADINLLLVAMLKEAGIEAYPVVLSTRANGKPHPVYPIMTKFNYVIGAVIIDEKYYLLDATNKALPANTLAERTLNGSGWLISEKPHWITLNSTTKMSNTTMVAMNLTEENTLVAILQSKQSSLSSALSRTKFLLKKEQEYLKDKFGSMTDWQITKSEFGGDMDVYQPFTEKVEFINNEVDLADIIYIDPFVFNSIQENVFKNENRKFPVDLPASIHEQYIFTFDIPEGYAVEEIPKSQAFALPDSGGSFKYSASVLGSKINVVASLDITKTDFPPDEYIILRNFFELIVAKYDEQIVLKKI